MYAPLATDDEIRASLGCNKNCNQGRACTCAPKPAEAATEVGSDEPEDLPLTDAEALQLLAVYVLSAVAAVACVAALINAAGLLL